MICIKDKDYKFWYIVMNEGNTDIHYGEIEIGQELCSSRDLLEEFLIEIDWINRLIELGINP